MDQLIIYKNPDGEVSPISVITPTGELPIEEVARKDVPAGLPYLFISADDVPGDRLFRNAWDADFSNPDGYGVGHEVWFSEQRSS